MKPLVTFKLTHYLEHKPIKINYTFIIFNLLIRLNTKYAVKILSLPVTSNIF